MHSLFWKIFLWFLLTLVLIASTSIWLARQSFDEQRFNGFITSRAQDLASTNVLLYEYAQRDALRIWRDEQQDRRGVRIYLVNSAFRDVLGESLNPSLILHLERIDDINEPYLSVQNDQRIISYPVETLQGDTFQSLFIIPNQFIKPPPGTKSWMQFSVIRLIIALAIIAIICLAIAYFLSKPLQRLTLATKRLADGDLNVRVLPEIGHRKDEIGVLGREFDKMAEQLQQTMDTQQRLLRDISHELRSPLARMQVALEIAKQQDFQHIPNTLSRIQKDSDRLNELINEILSLVKLDAGAVNRSQDQVKLNALINTIVNDAQFEQDKDGKKISVHSDQSYTVLANGELLHRALENIIRNALHYTKASSTVEIYVKAHPNKANFIFISVLDRGPGVLPAQLPYLFEPFFRTQSARDRDSGGYGLGLAIAERAIHFHGGSIKAYNRENGGLGIDISLPLNESYH